MRLTGSMLAGLILATTPGTAKAEDWRAVSISHHDVVFVDSDSVLRQADGRIEFRARNRLDRNRSNRDFGYDRIDLQVTARCRGWSSQVVPASSVRKYYLRGKAVAARDWREAELKEDTAALAETICRGSIGHRRFADLDRPMSEYGEHGSLERLTAYVAGETELTGVVVRGLEMTAFSLCGADACRNGPPGELCWLDGDIAVPAPAGGPDRVDGGRRRDSVGAAFRGRIYRSLHGRGFGHMGAMPCLVEATGPARFVEIGPPRPPQLVHGADARRPAALAAHAAFAQSIRAASAVELRSDDKYWILDDYAPSSSGTPSGGVCYSLPRFRGDHVKPTAPALAWSAVGEIIRRGNAVAAAVDRHDDDLDLYLPHAEAAHGIALFVRRLAELGVGAVVQQGSRLTVAGHSGSKEEFRFADAAEAVRAAGVANRLRSREIAKVKRKGNRVAILRVQYQTLFFPDAAKAAEAERRMRALRDACAPGEPAA